MQDTVKRCSIPADAKNRSNASPSRAAAGDAGALQCRAAKALALRAPSAADGVSPQSQQEEALLHQLTVSSFLR